MVKVVKQAPPPPGPLAVVEVIEAGPELVGGGEDTVPVLLPPLDWNEAFRLTFGEGRSEPASLEEVWLEELRDSTLLTL